MDIFLCCSVSCVSLWFLFRLPGDQRKQYPLLPRNAQNNYTVEVGGFRQLVFIKHRSMKWILLSALLVAAILVSALYVRPRKAYSDPLSLSFRLSGNFGELRSNHFHMGLDVRTNGKENMSVYAVATGYVSRILIEEYGLGKAIFITHPDGHTTVYAHLNRFYDKLQAAVERKQAATQQREQDISFSPGAFPIEKGQFIAYSGNTGGSEAPHLHFEVRDTRTGNNLNPLLYGFDMDDDAPPVLLGLYWYNRRYSTYRMAGNSITLQGKEGHYQPARDIIKVRSPLISLGIRAVDKSNDDRFRMGIYRAELRVDDSLVHTTEMNNFSYEDSRYINACIDYSRWIRTGFFVQHLGALPGNHLPVCKGSGIINLADKQVHKLNLRLYDVNNNNTTLEGKLQYSGAVDEPMPADSGAHMLVPGREGIIKSRQATVRFSKDAFYDTVLFALKEQPNTGSGKASARMSLHTPVVPVHDAYTVSLKASPRITPAWRNKVVMQLNNGKDVYTAKGSWDGDWLTASFNTLGTVQLLLDTIPPVMQTIGWRSGQTFDKEAFDLALSVTDAGSGISTFRAEWDGQWLLYDKKGAQVTLHISDGKPGPHTLNIMLADLAGNTTRQRFSLITK